MAAQIVSVKTRHRQPRRPRRTILWAFNWIGIATYTMWWWLLACGWRMPVEVMVPLTVVHLLGHLYLFAVLRR